MPHAHDSYAALRSGDFVRYGLAHFLDILGQQMLVTAVGWELYERTGSALPLGMIGLMQFLPFLVLSIPAGHLADSFDHRRILIGTQWLMIVATVGLIYASAFSWPIGAFYVCLFLIGVSLSISIPTRSAFYPRLVSASALHNSVVWGSGARQIATVLGPVLGGITIAVAGTSRFAYVGYVVCSMIFILLIWSIRAERTVTARQPVTLSSVLAGVRFIFRTRLILGVITLDLFAVLFGGAIALLPLFAKDILHLGPVGLGWLRTAPAIGSILMMLTVAHLPPVPRAGPALLGAVAAYGACMVAFGLSVIPLLSFAALLLSGAFDAVSVIIRHTLIQSLTPAAMRGRVFAATSLFGASSNELGGFESGVTAQAFGPLASVVGGGIASILVVCASMLLWPEIGQLKRLNIPDDNGILP